METSAPSLRFADEAFSPLPRVLPLGGHGAKLLHQLCLNLSPVLFLLKLTDSGTAQEVVLTQFMGLEGRNLFTSADACVFSS